MIALRQITNRLRPRGTKINRAPSPLLARAIPWVTIALASLLPAWLVIASAPILPPLGLLVLIAWMQLRPGVLPVWAGLPLGFFDDLYSGQPMGSATLTWSVVVMVLEVIETRLPWRNFLMEGLVAGGLIASYLVVTLGIANLAGGATPLAAIAPQLVVSILAYPLVCRLVARCDRLRLHPFMVLD